MNEEIEKAVFTGDTLLVGGCGRFVEGDAKDMYHVLYTILGSLPLDTKVYSGHESALINLQFASTVDPNNHNLRKKLSPFRLFALILHLSSPRLSIQPSPQ